MDDNAKQASSFQIDQEILDARGIDMTVSEVAGLSTVRYSERVQALKLNDEDNAFLKGLRRRIKNRLASQNSRRRSMEQLRRLAKELRAVRECKVDAAGERAALLELRVVAAERCRQLSGYLEKVLKQRSDPTPLPTGPPLKCPPEKSPPYIESQLRNPLDETSQKNRFECRIEKLVQQSVNHIFKEKEENPKSLEDKKVVCAKTVFISDGDYKETYSSPHLGDDMEGDLKGSFLEAEGVLNLSVRACGRKAHGRKQSAPRRIVAYGDDSVLDLKMKKEK